jgi:hypothetical protein
MPAPVNAVCQEVIWKNDEVLSFALSLVWHALAEYQPITKENDGSTFTTDIVPDAERGSGPGIAGSVITMLQAASVIQPVGIESNKQWYPLRIKSTRPAAAARWVNVYRLASRELAQAFLCRNQPTTAPQIATSQTLL